MRNCNKYVFIIFLISNTCNAEDNAITSAEDAFGMTVGSESLGVYSSGNVRGFSPSSAGNYRIEGLYFDRQSNLNNRIQSGSTIRVGSAVQGYAFPSPTGIIDINLKESGNDLIIAPKITFGPENTFGLELDAQIPIITDKLSTSVGTSAFKNFFLNGGHSSSSTFGIVPRWKPDPRIEVILFAGRSYSFGETTPATYITEGDFLPKRIPRGEFPGPHWATSNYTGSNFGGLVKGAFGDWTFRAGRFYSINDSGPSYANLFNLSDNGEINRNIVSYPSAKSTSVSGEIRISKLFEEGIRKHLITASFRDRKVNNRYGGGDSFEYKIDNLSSHFKPIKPQFNLGETTKDLVKQTTAAFSYGLFWDKIGEFTFGLQKNSYGKTVKEPNISSNKQNDDVWLPSLSISQIITKNTSFYANYVKGIEDAGVAPSYASNSNQVLPAIQTKQWDAGLQWKLGDKAKIILGYYDISKPYIATSQVNEYKSLGSETHKGFEISLTANPTKNLTLVAGAVLSKPRVEDVTETNEIVGKKAVAQSDNIVQLSVDYTVPWLEQLSLDGGFNYQSSQVATVSNNISIPAYSTIDLGARYKIKLGKSPSQLRVQLTNVTNKYSLYSLGSGAYETIDKRGISVSISSEF